MVIFVEGYYHLVLVNLNKLFLSLSDRAISESLRKLHQ